MPVYYRWRQSEFSAVLGELGIGIDAIINSQETKLLIQQLYKADLQKQRWIKAKEDAEDKKANATYFAWLEKNLGESLRRFLEVGNWISITGWCRQHVAEIALIVAIFYAAFMIRR